MKKVLVDTPFLTNMTVQQNSHMLAARALMKIRLSENSNCSNILLSHNGEL